jgi:glycosyltransferase involved in cell wall biosynthesis
MGAHAVPQGGQDFHTAVSRPPRPFARVSVVIPTLNEAANLPHVRARMPMDDIFEVIIVDGHSVDDTAEVARDVFPDARIIMQNATGIIVMLDADGSTDPAEIPQFIDRLHEGADFAKGSRFMDGGSSTDITPLRAAGNRMLNAAVNRLYGTHYTDLCYGYNAFWSDVLETINIDCDGFEVETLINVRIAKAGLRVAEVPSAEEERLFGVSKLNPVRDGLRVLRTIVSERLATRDSAIAPAPAFLELGHRHRERSMITDLLEPQGDVPAELGL